MDTESLKMLPQLGIGGLVAALIFFFYRKDVKQYTDLWQSTSEQLIEVVKDNTASNTRMIVLLDALHRRLDRNHIVNTEDNR